MPETRRTRGYRKKERTRRQLLAAGMRVLSTKGDTLTASDVSTEAEVAVGTFYNYFADRDALIDAVTEEQLHTLAATAATAEEPIPDPALRVALTSAVILRRAATDTPWARLVLRLVNRPTVYNRINGYLREDLSEGLAEGRFDTGPDDATLDQTIGLLVMTIRRIVAGLADDDVSKRSIERGLRALGVSAPEARTLAAAAVATASRTPALSAR
ncbi:MAG: TetR/AcrR family transcriptional regulator [Myxococcota bacterium]